VQASGLATKALASQTAMIMRERLAAAHVSASVKTVSGTRIEVSLPSAPPVFLSKLLTEPGVVEFRITPHGDVYKPHTARAIKSAEATYYMDGKPVVMFHTADPNSFRRFTAAHLNKDMGIYLDGRLLSDPVIAGPISDDGMIVGKFTYQQTQLIAAVIGSQPFPTRVKLVSETRTTVV
jgi:preprotein translocase subunit SecD